ncbi:MAG: prolyl oligopeptidase family serine peptidase [Candidatus Helarchaeota archaeon]
MNFKKIIKYSVITIGYLILIFGLFIDYIIITGGNLIFSLLDIIFSAIVIYTAIFFAIIMIIMISLHSKKHKYWLIPLILGFFIIILNLFPLFSAPYIVSNGDNQFRNEFGINYMDNISVDKKAKFKSTPISFWELINSVEIPDCNISYDTEVYATRGNDSYTFDVYSPLQGNGPFPAIILIHGGGWVRGDKGQLSVVSRYLAAQGYVIFDIRYGLAKFSEMGIQIPSNINPDLFNSKIYNESITIPQMVKNIGKFTDYLVANKDRYHINLSSVFIMGRSAGAHLAGLFLGYKGAFSGIFNTSMNIRGIILYYPPANLTMFYNSLLDDPVNKLAPGSTEHYFSYLLNGTPTTNKTAYDLYSPVSHVDSNSPPVLIFHGMHDKLVPYKLSVQLQNRMHAYNRPCILISYPFYGHAMDALRNGIGGQTAVYYLERFLAFTLENNI